MEFLQKVIQLYAERKEWFLDLFAAHVGLALTAAVSAGIIGLLLGIFISEHKKAAGPVLTIANIGYTTRRMPPTSSVYNTHMICSS